MEWWEIAAWSLGVFCEFVIVYGSISLTVNVEVTNARDAKRYNESVRYAASAINTLSVGMIAGGVLVPFINSQNFDLFWAVIWLSSGLALHIIGHLILGLIKKEDGYDG